jgi:AcrR family transcriptional regulator
MVLRESLLALMQTQNVSSISIKELCGNADIHRATFYANYKNTWELLYSIEDEILSDITAILGQYFFASGKDEAVKLILDVLQYIEKHRSSMYVLFSENGDMEFNNKLFNTLHKKIISIFGNKKSNTQKNKCYSIFAVSGVIGLVRNWSKNGMSMPKDELAAMIVDLTYYLHGIK